MSQKVSSHLYNEHYYRESDGISYYRRAVAPPKIKKAMRLANVKEEMTIVDIGCGRGDFIFALDEEKVRFIGIDYSQEAMSMSSSLRAKLPEDKQVSISLLLSDGTELPLKSQSADVIFLMDLIEHLYPEQLKKCMAECKRVLRTGGKLIIHTSPNRWYNDYGYPLWEHPLNRIINFIFRQRLLDRPIRTATDQTVHINEQTLFTLRRQLKDTGFKSKVWFGSEYLRPVKKGDVFTQLLEILRQMVCHLYPLSVVYPLRAFFSNDIWAVASK